MGERWTEAEDNVLREHVPNHGPSWSGWRDLLPGRTTGAIAARKHALGISGSKPRGGNRGGWTYRQHRDLLQSALSMAKVTGHTVRECIKELSRLEKQGVEARP